MKKKILSMVLALFVLNAFVPYKPVMADSAKVKEIVAGCALLEDGSVWTWGSLNGNGTYDGSPAPQKLMQDVKKIYYYNSKKYALKNDNSLWGWGWSAIGDGTSSIALAPVKIADGVERMCGDGYILKIDNSLWGWGKRIGDGTEETRLSPIKICDDVLETYLDRDPKYVIKTDNSLWGWGIRSWAETSSYIGVGDGTDNTRLSPVKILDDVKSISVTWCAYDISNRNSGASGYKQVTPPVVFAIKNDNTLWGWGANKNGQLIDGTTDYKLSPVKIMDDAKAIAASEQIGWDYTDQWYVIKDDNSLWGWGDNTDGVLGIGVTEETNIQSPIKIMDDVAEVYPYEEAVNFVKKTDDSLWVWGCNSNYALGTGKKNGIVDTPKKLLDKVTYFKHISGFDCSYAIDSEARLYRWGTNTFSDTYYYEKPSRLTGNVSKLFHTDNLCDYFLKNDGSLWGFGANYDGTLGDGTTTTRYNPVQIFFDESNDVTQSPNIIASETLNLSEHTFTVSLDRPYDSCYVYVAVYDENGRILSIKRSKPLNYWDSTTISVNKMTNEKTAKIYVWDMNMKPITEAYILSL